MRLCISSIFFATPTPVTKGWSPFAASCDDFCSVLFLGGAIGGSSVAALLGATAAAGAALLGARLLKTVLILRQRRAVAGIRVAAISSVNPYLVL